MELSSRQRRNIFVGIGLLLLLLWGFHETSSPQHTTPPPLTVDSARITAQFSVKDGSHRKLVQSVKATMLDPESFRHTQTIYTLRNNQLSLTMTYSEIIGMLQVTSTVHATATVNGDILTMQKIP